MNLEEQMKMETEDMGLNNGSLYFKWKEGDNKIRILTKGAVMGTHFFQNKEEGENSVCYGISKGCPHHKAGMKSASVKYVCYVWNLENNEIELADIPYSVFQQLALLQKDEDYAFTEFPMPYNLKVTFKKEASPNEKYKTIASPKREPVPEEILKALAEKVEKMSPEVHVANKKAKAMERHKELGIWLESAKPKELPVIKVDEGEVNPDDIPF